MTIQELESLSDEQLRVKCSELCGWEKSLAIGAEMKRRGWQKEQMPHYSLSQMPEERPEPKAPT